jgi:SAM-dependent methyltransferase
MTESKGSIGNVVQNRALTEIAMGFSRSRALCAAARLGVADALGGEERSVEELAAACGVHRESLYRLLRALASFGVVAERAPGRFVLTQFGRPLRKDVANSEWAAVVFWADLLADNWSQLTECVRTGDTAMRLMEREGVTSRWVKDPEARAIFGAVMGTAPAEAYMPIARAWDFSRYKVVADLGGGGGALIAAILEAYPSVSGMLADRQDAIYAARKRFEAEALAGRCELVVADLSLAVPEGADVYVLKHVLHGCDDEKAIGMLQNCRAALPKDGRVLVVEFVLPDVVERADPELEQRLMSDLNMLAVTGGKERSAAQWKQVLDGAGFECNGITAVPGDSVSIVEATARE